MKIIKSSKSTAQTLELLKHYLPSQAPLKDFIHHNTLHAFQHEPFYRGLSKAKDVFGYNVLLSLTQYQQLFHQGKIDEHILEKILSERKADEIQQWKQRLLDPVIEQTRESRIGQLRAFWKSKYKIDLDSLVHPLLFRLISSYLDQGIALWRFPISDHGFLDSVRELEKNSSVSFFRTERARSLLLSKSCSLESLLQLLLGDLSYAEHYLFDQQFAHPGWSGMVATIEGQPGFLTDQRTISLQDFIIVETLLEIDALDDHFGEIWSPLGLKIDNSIEGLFDEVVSSQWFEYLTIWHEAYEMTYYDQVLGAFKDQDVTDSKANSTPKFQAVFCIDDRECSIRRHLEKEEPNCETYGTPGFFNVAFYFQPSGSEQLTKLCPAPLTPKHLVKEIKVNRTSESDFHFNKHAHGLFAGWIATHTLGLISAFRLFLSVFFPRKNATAVSSFDHCHPDAELTVEFEGTDQKTGLQIGFTYTEMADRLEGLIKSIGLVDSISPIVYIVAHGSSSVNNTHFAGYDCGACSGRPGSVNARLMAEFGNKMEVREILRNRGVVIPKETIFIAALHDTSRDEIQFFNGEFSSSAYQEMNNDNINAFNRALTINAVERSRRFESITFHGNTRKVHRKVKRRTVSLFEPRPELNHATNALAIVGGRYITRNLFLDRRAFLNSYDYQNDMKGERLQGILSALAPVCGGINLEYFFSRVDNQQLGAGTKLPHNVMGLIGVANGTDGDLRTGLPSQMIEVHDPVRLCLIVEHFPEVIDEVLASNSGLAEWFTNEWIHLVAYHPTKRALLWYRNGVFEPYVPSNRIALSKEELDKSTYSSAENIPVTQLIR
jgi:uncharacterized protein YbcC (UPF0753/DUF2309 family)